MALLSKQTQFFLLSLILFLLLPVYLGSRWRSTNSCYMFMLEGVSFALVLVMATICYDISSMKPSRYLTYGQIFKNYLMLKFIFLAGYRASRQHEAASRNPGKTQLELLMRQLRRNKDTLFGSDHGFSQIGSVEEYRQKVPITDYTYYTTYTEKTSKGEQDILVPGKVDYLILTSGTTGNNKRYPFTKTAFWDLVTNNFCFAMYKAKALFPSRFHLRKSLFITVPGRVMLNEAGIRMGPVTSYMKLKGSMYTTPTVGWEECDEKVIMYIHALFALIHDDTTEVFLNFVALARSFFLTLENNWQDLVQDIRSGDLNHDLDLPNDLRQRLKQALWADPERADYLTCEFKKGFDNIIPRLWPNVSNISLACSGSLQTPCLNLQRKYFRGVPVVGVWHGASEGEFGVCLQPGDIKTTYYTTQPQFLFYEFIPLEEIDSKNPSVKLLEEVDLGDQYEICVTNPMRGIYRYKTGDIVKIIAWYYKTPVYEFIGRYGQLLNICGEKTSENAFNLSLEETLSQLEGIAMIDYSTAENRYLDNIQGAESGRYYLLFIEVESMFSKDVYLTENQMDKFDEVLQSRNENYKELRSLGRIQKMKVVQCQPGAFHRLKEYILKCNPKTSCTQYKTPRVLRDEGQLRVMLKNAYDSNTREEA